MRLNPLSKIQIARHLFQGKLSRRAIARRFGVSDDSVRRIARELGLVEIDTDPPLRRGKVKRCRGCGHPEPAHGRCKICEHRFREELKRRRREFDRELRDDPQRILRIIAEHEAKRARGRDAEKE